jgi:hypothetical protein
MYVTDLNSTNGTMVNGQELSPMDNVAVEVGSEVIFGEPGEGCRGCDLGRGPAERSGRNGRGGSGGGAGGGAPRAARGGGARARGASAPRAHPHASPPLPPGDMYLAKFQLDMVVTDAASPPSAGAHGAAASGSSGRDASGTVVFGAEDSGADDGALQPPGGSGGLDSSQAGGGGGGGRVKRQAVRKDYYSPY